MVVHVVISLITFIAHMNILFIVEVKNILLIEHIVPLIMWTFEHDVVDKF